MTCGVICQKTTKMRFEFLVNQEGQRYIEDFLSDFDINTHLQITEKFEHYESLEHAHLFRAEYIKKIDEDLYEVRMRVNKKEYRFLGKIESDIFIIVNAYHKKSNKLPLKEIKKTKNRLNRI